MSSAASAPPAVAAPAPRARTPIAASAGNHAQGVAESARVLGMKATINSDDPAYFRGYMNENLVALHEDAGFTAAEITTLVRNSFDVAWLDEARRSHYLALLDASLS